MAIAFAVYRKCCCCCGPRHGAATSLANGAANGARLLAGGSGGAGQADGGGPEGWRRRAQAGERYRVPRALYEQLSRAADVPVLLWSRCGYDRDCTPDDRLMPSFIAAQQGAQPWLARGSGRFVEIRDKDSKALISRLDSPVGGFVEFDATTRDEFEMRSIQNSPNAGRFGFFPA